MIDDKYILNKHTTSRTYNVKQATEILTVFGISHSERKTRELITKGRLVANWKGKANDFREGYEITEKALYDLVVHKIPLMKPVFDLLHTKKKVVAAPAKKEVAAKPKQQRAPRKKKENTESKPDPTPTGS